MPASPGLSNEIKQKFVAVRPASLGQAGRIEGVTPAALALVAAHARRARAAAGRAGSRLGREPPPVDGLALADQLAEDRAAALRLVPVSRETEERLALFVDLLARWRSKTNLIAEFDLRLRLDPPYRRFRASCSRSRRSAKRWVDMGSGAGFPGLVIAIQLADVPGAVVHCIESDQRKCAFLREAARATGARGANSRQSRVEADRRPKASDLWTP